MQHNFLGESLASRQQQAQELDNCIHKYIIFGPAVAGPQLVARHLSRYSHAA